MKLGKNDDFNWFEYIVHTVHTQEENPRKKDDDEKHHPNGKKKPDERSQSNCKWPI